MAPAAIAFEARATVHLAAALDGGGVPLMKMRDQAIAKAHVPVSEPEASADPGASAVPEKAGKGKVTLDDWYAAWQAARSNL